MNCKTKYKNKFNFLDVQMLSKYSSTFCFLQMFPGVTLYLYLYFLIVCLDLNCLSPQLKPSLQRGGSSASLHNSTMRNTIFQLMIHTLDPLGDGQYTRNVMMSLKCPIDEVWSWQALCDIPGVWLPLQHFFFLVHTGVSKRSKRWALSFLGSSFTA